MFREGAIEGVRFEELKQFNDQRGWLCELFRHDEIQSENWPVMAYVSETLPGVSRGPHEHVDQSDYFAFIGPGDFKLYLWDARVDSPSHGHRQTVVVGQSNRQSVIVPPGVIHAYQNISDQPGWVFNGPNRLYAGHGKQEPVDEIRHEERDDGLYHLD
jgi:dTDP-4-dehydrorhamnose 3,5-epimerase